MFKQTAICCISVSQLAKETTSATKNVNVFLMWDFYFKRRAWKLLTLVRCSLSKECLRKTQYLRSDEMFTGLMTVSLFYTYFCNLWNKKSFTSEKLTILCCQMLYHVHSKAQKLRACNAWNKSTVPINHITVLRVLAGKDLHEGMIFIIFRSSFHISFTVHDSIVYLPW